MHAFVCERTRLQYRPSPELAEQILFQYLNDRGEGFLQDVAPCIVVKTAEGFSAVLANLVCMSVSNKARQSLGTPPCLARDWRGYEG